MPRRNIYLLVIISAVSLVCYLNVNRYGRILTYAMEQIDRRYLEEIDRAELFEGAMEGMIGRLDDYSSYINSKAVEQFQETLDQKFGGVGMEVSLDPKTKQLTVLSPIVGTPAYEAGIRAGDKILKIDGQTTQGLSLRDAVDRTRGKPGQPVVLTILHEGDNKPVDIEVVRDIIRVETVLGDTRNADASWNYFLAGHDRIGYLRINTFGEETPEEMKRALKWLTEHGMRGLILDLRNDPGGLLAAAVEVSDLFVASGVIVTTRRRDGHVEETYEATGDGTYTGFPMAVLVNQYTASASEIVAACLQDHARAVIVGQRTWGKGTVQEVINLESGQGMIKLTTASYWRPTGKNIHHGKDTPDDGDWGVMPDPDCEVVVEGNKLTELLRWRLRRDVYKPAENNGPANHKQPPVNDKPDFSVDPQLQRAIEYIEKAIAEKK